MPVALVSASFALLCLVQPSPEPPRAAPLRVMTFNVRLSALDQGEQSWHRRRELAVAAIRERQPHVLGLQEALPQQQGDLLKAMPFYDAVGHARVGLQLGEYTPILVDRRRLAVERHGHLWLSPTPQVPLTKGWDAIYPKTCAWAVLRELRGDARFVVFNAHFDHLGERARLHSARLLVRELAAYARLPVLVIGDLNALESEAPLQALFAVGLKDSFRVMHPDAKDVRTSHHFAGVRDGPRKIDHVLGSADWRVLSAGISHFARDGRYPSDHFPVWAELALPDRPNAAGGARRSLPPTDRRRAFRTATARGRRA